MTLVSPGIYQHANGRFYARIRLRGRRTWRALKATKLPAAIVESAKAEWQPGGNTFTAQADLYTAAGCPTKRTKFLSAPAAFQSEEKPRVTRLKRYYGKLRLDQIDLASIVDFAKWRLRGKPSGHGTRAVDKESQTLSNVLNYAVFITKAIVTNPVRSNRPRFHVVKTHSRERMPENADVIHAIANHFFNTPRMEVHGWHVYLAMFTGGRTSELLRLRLDAAPGQAGYLQPSPDPAQLSPLYTGTLALLHLQRSKGGINPWSLVGPEFAQMLECFRRWHVQHAPENPYFLPSPYGGAMTDRQFSRAMVAACSALGLPRITPHGFRAYYVTKRRRDLIPDPMVAAEIGDKTVSLIQTTYGETPGLGRLTWLPSAGLPAWLRWRPESEKLAAALEV